ncbi:MAG: nuclear transport factor 2 family protein [Pseudomonadales bacterium]
MGPRTGLHGLAGGSTGPSSKDAYHVQMESPIIRVYGNTAVASYLRRTQVMPADGPIVTQPPLWISLVLVKEKGSWGIAHSHISPARPWN